MCVCVCVCACVRACVRVCVRACVRACVCKTHIIMINYIISLKTRIRVRKMLKALKRTLTPATKQEKTAIHSSSRHPPAILNEYMCGDGYPGAVR